MTTKTVPAVFESMLRRTYDAFNRRDVDAVLSVMTDDVDWPDMLAMTRAVGKEKVRDYWIGQFAQIDPSVEPIGFAVDERGDVVVTVHQVIRSLSGTVVADQRVQHAYTVRDGRVCAMDVRDETGSLLSAPRQARPETSDPKPV
jgi:hypothetical protein